MASSLVRGRYVITKVDQRGQAEVIDDGAVFQRDGWIVEVGKYETVRRKYQPDELLGSSEHVVLPGLVNAHHHVGLTPFQLGSPDYPLELWFASRLGARDVDPYLDTLYSAFEMIESGITTVQHLHGTVSGPIERISRAAQEVLRAYKDIGMRVSYSFAIRDQNQFVYDEEHFARELPQELAASFRRLSGEHTVPLKDHLGLFVHLWRKYQRDNEGRVRIQLAPGNLHWCTDKTLETLREYSASYSVGMHVHLLETGFQKEYARLRAGGSALEHLHKLGLLGPSLTIGHAVWITEREIDLIEQTGTMICHNASSNLRLRSGIAPINYLVRRGVRVAIGLDEAGINDDRDMLQEMRLVLSLHQEPGIGGSVLAAPHVIRMATEDGAATTGFAGTIGTLESGKAADVVIVNWHHIEYPHLDAEVPVADAVVRRAKTEGVETVMVAGKVVLKDRQFTRVDKDEVLTLLSQALRAPLRPEEKRRRRFSKRLFPYFKGFYENWLVGETRDPYYKMNSRS